MRSRLPLGDVEHDQCRSLVWARWIDGRVKAIENSSRSLDSLRSLEVCLLGVESAEMTAREDIATVARQLAALTQTVEEMAGQLKEVRERAENERERTDVQQERIDLAARELSDVSDRLQAAATALRESI